MLLLRLSNLIVCLCIECRRRSLYINGDAWDPINLFTSVPIVSMSQTTTWICLLHILWLGFVQGRGGCSVC